MGHKPCVGAHARRHKCTAHRCGSGGVTATALSATPAQDESRQEALKVDHNHVQTPHQATMYRKLRGNIYILYMCVCGGVLLHWKTRRTSTGCSQDRMKRTTWWCDFNSSRKQLKSQTFSYETVRILSDLRHRKRDRKRIFGDSTDKYSEHKHRERETHIYILYTYIYTHTVVLLAG